MLSAQMKQFSIIEPDYFLPILRDLAGAKPIPQVSARQLASITAFLRSPSTILIDMACLRTIRTSDSSTDHEFLVGSIEVRLMYGIATSRSATKSAKVKSSQRCSTLSRLFVRVPISEVNMFG